MCGRFDQIYIIEKLAKRFLCVYKDIDFKARYNIAPSQEVPVVINRGENELKLFKWGLVPSWAKDPAIGHKMINARAETLDKKPSFKESLKTKRCLVPATGFYEWQKKNHHTKIPMRVTLKTEEPFAFAGLWSTWQQPKGTPINTFTIITTQASELLKPVHDRMPAILKPEEEALWLSPNVFDINAILALLSPYPSHLLKVYEVSSLVNSPENDTPECIRPK